MKRISDHQAVLIRDFRVRAINISGSGCLIESRRRLDVGTVGTLRLTLGTEECVDDVEVVRCEAAGDVGTVYHVGVRFRWAKPREAGSIRHAIARHVADLNPTDTTRVM